MIFDIFSFLAILWHQKLGLQIKKNIVKDAKQQVQFIAKQVLSRTLIAAELDPIVTVFKKFRMYYDSHKKDAEMLLTVGQRVPDPQLALDQQAAAMLVANLFLNTDEAITYE